MPTSGWDGNDWADGGTGKLGNTHDGGTGNGRDVDEMPYLGTVDGGVPRQRYGRGREVAVVIKTHSGLAFPPRPVPDQTAFC